MNWRVGALTTTPTANHFSLDFFALAEIYAQ
jgi:hypothetical protein